MLPFFVLPPGGAPASAARRAGRPRAGRLRMGTSAETTTQTEGSPSPDPVLTLEGQMDAFEKDIEDVLITQEDIRRKLAELGDRITADYRGHDLLLIGVLKGAFV